MGRWLRCLCIPYIVEKMRSRDFSAKRRCREFSRRKVPRRRARGEVSTSYAERQNLTMRMNIRRLTRLTNAHSKKLDSHKHAISLYFMHYNFCRKHETLTKAADGIHTTPAMAAGVSDHVWKLEEVVALLD
jgi:hypothetical protein